jgi:hypothetical protein
MGSRKSIMLDAKLTDEHIIQARIKVNYNGRYDGVQVNAHVYESKGVVRFIEVNGRQESLYRLFISKDDLARNSNEAVFKAVVDGKDAERVRLRASIIQEHKEVDYDYTVLDLHNH